MRNICLTVVVVSSQRGYRSHDGCVGDYVLRTRAFFTLSVTLRIIESREPLLLSLMKPDALKIDCTGRINGEELTFSWISDKNNRGKYGGEFLGNQLQAVII